jgi:hexosaminidase
MKKLFSITLLVLSVSAAFAQSGDSTMIIPKPASVEKGTGSFTISAQTKLIAPGVDAKKVADMFNYFLMKKCGFTLKVASAGSNEVMMLLF